MHSMWQLRVGQTLQHRLWNGEAVLYNSLSGDTHLLGADALHLLLVLQHGAADAPALTASLRSSLALAPNDADEAEVGAILAELQALALIEMAAC